MGGQRDDLALRRVPAARNRLRRALLVLLGAILAVPMLSTAAAAQGETDFGSTRTGVRELDGEIDRSIDHVRIFEQWDSEFPSAEEQLHLDAGRTLLLSIFPQRLDGTYVAWADIAAAQPGSAVHNDLLAWAAKLEPYEGQIYITFNHEPETVKNQVLGTAADFQGAWQNTMSVFADAGLDTLGRLFIVTSASFRYPSDDRRAFDDWYPGDGWIDAVGGDAYNFFTCRPNELAAWRSLAEVIEAQRLWGLAHPTVDMMLPEYATVGDPADPSRKAAWLDEAAALFADPAYDQFTLALYFYQADPANPACDYVPRSDVEIQAFYDMVGDPALGGTAPAGHQAPTRCTINSMDGTVAIDWRPSYRANGYQLTRSVGGAAPVVVHSGAGLSFSEPAVAGGSYTIASLDDAGSPSSSAPCTDPDPEPEPLQPPATCEWVRADGNISVTWVAAVDAVDYIVRRTVNGNGPYWRGRTSELGFTDTDRAADITYQVTSSGVHGDLSEASTVCADANEPVVLEPPTECGFVRENGEVAVTWQPGEGAVDTIVRRTVNGNGPYWRARVTGSSFTDTDRAGTMNYVVSSRNASGTETASVDCIDNTAPPVILEPAVSCSFVRVDGSITVSWEPGAGTVDTIVYRSVNGNGPYWRGRTAEPTFVDSDRSGVITYEVRGRSATGDLSATTSCTDLT